VEEVGSMTAVETTAQGAGEGMVKPGTVKDHKTWVGGEGGEEGWGRAGTMPSVGPDVPMQYMLQSQLPA
jgi:hypothetical protein